MPSTRWFRMMYLRRHYGIMDSEVRVRFAPSPTGKLHLGGLRTALFNYLFARSHGGKFILRIEDTDRDRIVPGCAQKFEETLDRYGLLRDESPSVGGSDGPYLQSKRNRLYIEAVEELIDRGHAYRCFCTLERLNLLRRDALRRHETPKYDNRCRTLPIEEVRSRLRDKFPHVIRFKVKRENVTFEDKVFGEINQFLDEGDFILIKSDFFPTYHLANVVDDHIMRISHVIRGMEWIPSTPKHVQLYKAFNWSLPAFIHLPLITRDGSKKLSKRDKDAFVEFYDEEKGYLPSAVLNFLIRNGSGIRNFDANHLYSLEEMVANFDVELIGKRNFMMDQQSLDHYGRLAFRSADVERQLVPEIKKRIRSAFPEAAALLVEDPQYINKVVNFLHKSEEAFACLSQLTNGDFKFFFSLPSSSQKISSLFGRDWATEMLQSILNCTEWTLNSLKAVAMKYNVAYPKLLHLVRLALIDSKSGPPITELVEFFGEKECAARVAKMLAMLKKGN